MKIDRELVLSQLTYFFKQFAEEETSFDKHGSVYLYILNPIELCLIHLFA